MPKFDNSKQYWKRRYREGLNSGPGSYGRLARFKAKIINKFVEENNIHSVIEWGCGDGEQLRLAKYPSVLGVDVSEKSIETCLDKFRHDNTKSFLSYDPQYERIFGKFLQCDLALSLDVIYHLIEDDVYNKYMCNLFDSSSKFVIIYSSNKNETTDAPHVKHRKFDEWVVKNRDNFSLLRKVDNPFPYDPNLPKETSFADFYIYIKGNKK